MVALALNTGLIPLAARPARAQKRVAARAAVVPKVRRLSLIDVHARARRGSRDRPRPRSNRFDPRARSPTIARGDDDDDRPTARAMVSRSRRSIAIESRRDRRARERDVASIHHPSRYGRIDAKGPGRGARCMMNRGVDVDVETRERGDVRDAWQGGHASDRDAPGEGTVAQGVGEERASDTWQNLGEFASGRVTAVATAPASRTSGGS